MLVVESQASECCQTRWSFFLLSMHLVLRGLVLQANLLVDWMECVDATFSAANLLAMVSEVLHIQTLVVRELLVSPVADTLRMEITIVGKNFSNDVESDDIILPL